MSVFILHTQEVDEALARGIRASKDLRPAWREIRKPFRDDQRAHAKEAEGPDGAWPPLAQSTLARRARDAAAKRRAKGGLAGKVKRARRRRRVLKQRRVLGRLPSIMDIQVTRTSLIATNKVSWADAHFSGRTVGHGVSLPKREFWFVSDALEQKIVTALGKHVAGGFER